MSKTMNERPCPCGSGTRHDECCGPVRRGPLERFTEEDLRQAFALATREVDRPEFSTWHATAAQEFLGGWLDAYLELDPDTDEDFDLHDAHTIALTTWLLFDRALDDGTRPVARLLERRGSKLLPGVRNALSALCATRPQLLEIMEIHEGAGFVVEDVFDGVRAWISETSAGEAEVAGDVLLARVFRDPRGVRSFLPDARCFEGEWKDHLRATVTQLRHEVGLTDAPSETEFWKRIGPELHELWCEWAHGGEEVGEGDLALHRSTYRVVDAAAIEDRLGESALFHASDDGEWMWRSSELPSERGIGFVEREDDLLYLVTFTQAAHDELRAAAEKELGAAVEHVRSEVVDREETDAEREA